MKQPIIPYRSNLTGFARRLRRKMTLAEVLLWNQLRRKQLCGYDFDRQRPLGRHIVDFYCKELQLAVDLDGSVHDRTREKDVQRHGEVEALGVTHFRFWNYDVKNNSASVLKKIEDWIRAEEIRRGWPRREEPPFIRRTRATRKERAKALKKFEKPTPSPLQGGERE